MKKYLFVVFSLVPLSIYAQLKTAEMLTDSRDGNTYKYVKIGTQVWMAENLKANLYNDRTKIPIVVDAGVWYSTTSGACCWYNNDTGTNKDYGALYNWHAVRSGKLCPVGWHVPSDAEWTTLERFLIANGYDYDKSVNNRIAKSMAAITNWASSDFIGSPGKDLATNNRCGFTGLPGGYRTSNGVFLGVGSQSYWWSSTEYTTTHAWYRFLSYNNAVVYRYTENKRAGYSVRCVRDN